MGGITVVHPAALVAGITYADDSARDGALGDLTGVLGPIEIESGNFDFNMTDYYTEEMGSGLRKRFVCFTLPIETERLPDIKIATNSLEAAYPRPGAERFSRRVNIDPGYVTLSKLVLATTKDYSHRIHLGKGIFAETTLRFIGGTFAPFETTYPDYRTPLALDFFNKAREYVKRSIEEWIRARVSKS